MPQLSPNLWMISSMFSLLMFMMMFFGYSLFKMDFVSLSYECYDKNIEWLW